MHIDPAQVSAVIPTRGNVDLSAIVDSLIFEEIIIWDNSRQTQPPAWWWSSSRRPITWCGSEDAMTYGRVRALDIASHSVIFSQDDDIIHTAANQRAILSAYQPGVLTGCMWGEWSDGARSQGIQGGYEDLVFAGSGSVYDIDIPDLAASRYLDHYPLDDFFLLWADTIIGILAPTRQLDIRFESLPEAEADYRMCNLEDAVALKTEAIRRAREIRDLVPA